MLMACILEPASRNNYKIASKALHLRRVALVFVIQIYLLAKMQWGVRTDTRTYKLLVVCKVG